jgi:hypothetical protein
MKAFTVEFDVTEAIRIERTPYPHIGVGEEGRGRVYTRVPVGSLFADSLEKDLITRASVIQSRKGTLLVVEERDPNDRRALVLVDVPAGYRGGTLWENFPSEGVKVLAEGFRAQGQAGRMGGHVVRLLILEPGATFQVTRTGRLYGAPATLVIHWDGETLRVGEPDVVFPPIDDDGSGELI